MRKTKYLYIGILIVFYLLFIFISKQQEIMDPFSHTEVTLLLILFARNTMLNEHEQTSRAANVNMLIIAIILVSKFLSLSQ